MILVYSAFPFNHAKIQKAVDIIKDRFSIFFIDNNDIFLSTQTSQKHLRDLIKNNPILVLTADTKAMLEDEFEIKAKNVKLNRTTIQHNIIEQITDYHLSLIGSVERTTVSTHQDKLNHIPDFIFTNSNGNKINIEIELSKKSAPRYTKLMQDVVKDNPDAIIYILDSKTKIKSFASIMPKWQKLYFISIDELIKNINELGQIKPIPQEQSLVDSPI